MAAVCLGAAEEGRELVTDSDEASKVTEKE
jgi:hypothetical protein